MAGSIKEILRGTVPNEKGNWKKASKYSTVHPKEKLGSIPVKKNDVVLDVGCGAGIHSILLSQKGALVLGIDADKNNIALANALVGYVSTSGDQSILENGDLIQRLKRIEKDGGLKIGDFENPVFRTANASNLPLQDNSVDVVLILDVLHRLPPALSQKVMAEIFRVLKNGGLLVTSNWPNDTCVFYEKEEWSLKDRVFGKKPTELLVSNFVEMAAKKKGITIERIPSQTLAYYKITK